jgi:hypothetical protein
MLLGGCETAASSERMSLTVAGDNYGCRSSDN